MENYYEIIDFLDHYAGKKYTASDFDIYKRGSRAYANAELLAYEMCKRFADFKSCKVSKWQNSGHLAKYFWIQFKRTQHESSPYSISIINTKVNGKYAFKVYLEVDNNKANIFIFGKEKIIDFHEAVLQAYRPNADVYYEGMTCEKQYYRIASDYNSVVAAVNSDKYLKVTTNIDVEVSADDSNDLILKKLSAAFEKIIPYYDAVFGNDFSNWIIPCNVDKYDIFSAFKKHDEIEWHYTPQTQKIRVGDKVYLYVGKPYSRIMYECDVVKTNILAREINDSEFIKNEFAFGDVKYFRIKRLRKIEDLNLSMSALNNHGIKGNIQGARRLEKETVEYIEKVVSSDSLQSNVEVVDDVSFIAEEEIEAILNAKDDTACYVYKVDVVKLRKLNQKQIDKLKGLYKGQCQLCGQNYR